MQENVWVQVFWAACVVVALVAAVVATRFRSARYAGRIAVGTLMVVGGAVFNAVNLLTGNDYGDFADQALFSWVTTAWRTVVAPQQLLFIGLLVLFEAAVGLLILSGGRRTQVGYLGAVGFHAVLWLFGWITAVYAVIMLPILVLLVRAEYRTETTETPVAGTPAIHAR